MDRLYETERCLDHASPTPDEWLAASFDLDGASRVTTVTDPLGDDTYYTYDGAGRRAANEKGKLVMRSVGRGYRAAG